MNALNIVAIIAIVAYVIGRQLIGEPLRGKRVLLLPAVLAIVGVVDLATKKGHPATVTDVVLLGIGAAIAAIIGVRQGVTMRLESRNGHLWGQMPVASLWLWGILVASRGGLDGLGYALGAHLATSSSAMLLGLGINRLAQAAVVAPRALSAGIPFAPEKDGASFLPALFGSPGDASPAQPSTSTERPSIPRIAELAGRQSAGPNTTESTRVPSDTLDRPDWQSVLRYIVDRFDDRRR
ncbi:MAG: hypothetical protein JWO62_539 [Acidimicrobiaceae bacterium]|nr:hypothetical protein [Acidimicrobiaceae bacterium]